MLQGSWTLHLAVTLAAQCVFLPHTVAFSASGPHMVAYLSMADGPLHLRLTRLGSECRLCAAQLMFFSVGQSVQGRSAFPGWESHLPALVLSAPCYVALHSFARDGKLLKMAGQALLGATGHTQVKLSR